MVYYNTLEWAILHDKYFNFWYLHFLITLLYFYLSKIYKGL